MQKYKILRKVSEVKQFRKQENITPLNLEQVNFFITCQAGVESLIKKESEKIGLKNFAVQDRIIRAT